MCSLAYPSKELVHCLLNPLLLLHVPARSFQAPPEVTTVDKLQMR